MIAALKRLSRRIDRTANRALERAYPPLRRAGRWAAIAWSATVAWSAPKLRPAAALGFRALAAAERALRRTAALAVRGATALSEVVTPARAIAAVLVAAGACLIVSQFIDYRSVEIGQPGYANLPGVAEVPTVDVKTAGEAHAFLLVPVGALAIAIGVALMGRRERPRLALLASALGLVSVAVILLVDLPAGLDAGAVTTQFADATAVLEDGFSAELAAAGAMVLAGLLYYARPCRIRTNSSGRAASARRRRPRRRASSRARVARSA